MKEMRFMATIGNGSTKGVTRRSLIAGAAGAGLAAGALVATAGAEEAASEFDVVIVGAGLGGLLTGIKVLELGRSAVIVEKLSTTGGNSAISGGTFILPPTEDEEGEAIFVEDLMGQSSGRADRELLEVVAQRAWESRRWMGEQGVQFVEPTVTVPFRVLGNTPEPGSWSMFDALDILCSRFEELGGTILLEHKMLRLVENDNGVVTGVEVRTPQGKSVIEGRCVILATGGYAGNKTLLEQFIGPDADEMMVRGRTTATGDGMVAAQALGAGLAQVGGYEALHIAAVSPENRASGNPSPGIPYMVAVNSQGKRFVDESLGYVAHGKAVAKQPGVKDALVFDAAQLEANGYVQYAWGLFEKLGLTTMVTADTLEELAEKIEVPVDTFVATIEEYNAHVNDDQTATGLEVGKASCAFPVAQPPFYALYPLVPGVTLSFGGLKVDTSARVLEPDGCAIPGLYAVGEVTGGMFVEDYIAGASLAQTAVYAMVAAETAVGEMA